MMVPSCKQARAKGARAKGGGGDRGPAEAARRIAKTVEAADVVLALTYKPAGRTRVVARSPRSPFEIGTSKHNHGVRSFSYSQGIFWVPDKNFW